MKQNIGIILIAVGALLLVLGFFSDYVFEQSLTNYNAYDICCWLLMVAGLVTHIVMRKKPVA